MRYKGEDKANEMKDDAKDAARDVQVRPGAGIGTIRHHCIDVSSPESHESACESHHRGAYLHKCSQ